MKVILAIALLGALASTTASATTFDFSYTFLEGYELTGSLDGTLVGTSIEDVSNVQMQFQGFTFDQPLYAGVYNLSTGAFTLGNPIISTDGTQNSFIFANAPNASASQYFLFSSAASEVFVDSPVLQVSDGPYTPSAWHIEAVAPVPVPAAAWLLSSGLGLLGAWGRRKA